LKPGSDLYLDNAQSIEKVVSPFRRNPCLNVHPFSESESSWGLSTCTPQPPCARGSVSPSPKVALSHIPAWGAGAYLCDLSPASTE